ncbi:MAG TPA: MutS family DNA mismatch repair protein [Terriglobales bacterium]|nr:MutS family DNA mismatch repair protein [Terriglobales bacterium]
MTARSRARQLDRLLARLDRLLTRGERVSSHFTRWRLAIFIAGLISTIALYKMAWYRAGNASLATFVAIFLAVAAYHNRLEQRIHRLRLWKRIKQAHRARLDLNWEGIPYLSSPVPAQHLYAKDLDLVGPHSLLHLLDTTVSTNGHARLTTWLLNQPPTPPEWETRRRLIRELSAQSPFRDRLTLEARLIGEQEIDGKRLEAVLRHQVGFPRLTMILTIQSILAATTICLGISALAGWLPDYWLWSFGVYALIYLQTDQGEELLEHAVGVHHELEQLGAVLEFVEGHAHRRDSVLAAIWAPLLSSQNNPPRLVRQAARTLHAISIKAHPLVHLLVNLLCPWDLWFTRRLRKIQMQAGGLLPVWLDRLAEVEAASALATFAYLHPGYAWPTPRTAAVSGNGIDADVTAQALGHPLIPEVRRVANDVSLHGVGHLHLVTGSNMSGKSTFLRTVGVNVCLAQAGAPVCASRFQWTWSRLGCCIRVDDSLEAGLSFFYAEVKRLKTILDATQDRTLPPLLFLIDEIFKGTNNRERLIGSRAYIKALAAGNGFGLVSTHDLELTDLEKEVLSLTNTHFQETVSAGALQFDYRLRPGPCPTTNALRIMELEGLPVLEEGGGSLT